MTIMSESEQQEAREAIGRKYRGCPNCGTSSATVGDVVALGFLDRAVPSGVALSDRFLAVLPLTCNSCGYTSSYEAREFVKELREQQT